MTGIDGYDWSPLGGSNPVPGDPDAVRAMAERFSSLSSTVGLQNRLLRAVSGESSSVWKGPAAEKFHAKVGPLPGYLDKLVASYDEAASALGDYWPKLGEAQSQALQALAKARAATRAIGVTQAQLASQHDEVAATAATYNRLVAPPAPSLSPPTPSQRLSQQAAKAQAQANYQAAQAQAANTQAQLDAAQQSLTDAHTQCAQAVSIAKGAARACGSRLAAASKAGIQNPHHSFWGGLASHVVDVVDGKAEAGAFHWVTHQAGQFASGVWSGVEGPLVMLAKLADPLSAPAELQALAKGLAYGITHPLAFGEAMLDWKDLSSGNIARWLGEMAPAAVAALFTGGAGDVAKGLDGVTALEKAGMTADDVAALVTEGDQEAAARIVMRGEDPVAGKVYADQPAQLGRDLSTGKTPDELWTREANNFVDRTATQRDPAPEQWVGNVHDKDLALKGDQAPDADYRTLKWSAKPTDLLKMSDEDQYAQEMALLPNWGARNEVTILHFQEGGTSWEGAAAKQVDQETMTVYQGGGHQILRDPVFSDNAMWTGPAPWEKVRSPALALRGTAKLGGAAGFARLPAEPGQ